MINEELNGPVSTKESFIVGHPEKDQFPQPIWLDLAEDNPDNSVKLYHSKEGLKDPFPFCEISRLFHKNRNKE